LDAVSTVIRAEEQFTEGKGLPRGGPSRSTRGDKRKCQDSKPTVAAKRVKNHYPAKEKADYPKKKAGPRRVKK